MRISDWSSDVCSSDLITPQHLGELNALRRHATLAATGIRLEEDLTDATLTMFDKLLGSMVRRAENRTRDKALKTVRELQGHLRTLTGSCRILIDARTNGVDSLADRKRTRLNSSH